MEAHKIDNILTRISDAAAEHADDGDDGCSARPRTGSAIVAGRWVVPSWIECK